MKVMLAQVNPCVGDLKGNWSLMQQEINYAAANEVDVVVFPELVTTGYPPRDLLYRSDIWESHDRLVIQAQSFVAGLNRQITVIFGGLHQVQKTHGMFSRYNAAFIIDKDSTRVVHKRLLPCYDVFDETRYFQPADNDEPYLPIPIRTESGEIQLCDVLICEDIWNYRNPTRVSWMSPSSYGIDPVSRLTGDGPIFVINGSPFWRGKIAKTHALLKSITERTNRVVCWVNQVGAHDDIVTYGGSMIIGPFMEQHAACFALDRLINDLTPGGSFRMGQSPRLNLNGKEVEGDDIDMYYLFSAIKLSLQDYMRRCGMKKIVFGASGGIDSAVVGALAAEALGGENCTAITLPSPFSSVGSWKDAEKLAELCGMKFLNWSITEMYKSAREKMLSGARQSFENSVVDENIQPRVRAVLLMMYSNEENALLLTTGNKSEVAVGYCTIYGDTAGGYALLSDVWKTEVYRLARFINKYCKNQIPLSTIEKSPSAELKKNQCDMDTLPPYDVLDAILRCLIERDMSVEEAARQPFTQKSVVLKIAKMIESSEFKRAQAPPGPKVSERAFGSGRRIPIAKKIRLI